MNERIAILADSACDLPREIIERFKIKILPLKVIYPEKTYCDRIDIQPNDVYIRMPEEIPTTSMPSVHDIKNMIENIKKEGFTHIMAIPLSSGLSGTYQTIKMVASEIDDIIIDTFDSKTLSMGTGWMVLETAKNIAKGLSFREIKEQLKNLQPKSHVFFVVETLEYLRRGGRIGYVAGMLGQALHFKPIISVNHEGKYFTYCKARGRSKSISKLIQIVEEHSRDKEINLAVLHGGALAEGEKVVEKIRQLPNKHNIREIIFSDITPALGVHTGPGLLGICLYEV